jgi:hypothetical protein
MCLTQHQPCSTALANQQPPNGAGGANDAGGANGVGDAVGAPSPLPEAALDTANEGERPRRQPMRARDLLLEFEEADHQVFNNP